MNDHDLIERVESIVDEETSEFLDVLLARINASLSAQGLDREPGTVPYKFLTLYHRLSTTLDALGIVIEREAGKKAFEELRRTIDRELDSTRKAALRYAKRMLAKEHHRPDGGPLP